TKGIFDAFRTQGFWVGAYFSKPDWHSPDYWWPYFATPDRNPNYDIKKYPDRWARFVAFTHAQIGELMSNYGRIDIPRLAAEARAKQPGLIVVDRDVPGPYQNYLTPEARVPEKALPYPWEVPMPMAGSWSYVPK